jgi:16S rRNA (guanine966-N2)-methyltransferase
VATLRYEDRALVLPTDVFRWARTFEPAGEEPMVVFIDPPYREYENHPKRLAGLLALLIERLPAGSIIALEASRGLDPDVLPDAASWDVRRYGGTQIAVRVSEPKDEAADTTPAPEPEDGSRSEEIS